MSCVNCKQPVSAVEVAKCAVCSNQFHPGCCRIRTADKLKQLIARGGVWKCESCSSKLDTDDISTFDMLKNIQNQMAADSKDFKTSFATLEKSMALIQESLANVAARLSDVERANTGLHEECCELRADNAQLNKRLWEMESRVLEMEQHSRMANLEIRGIPATRNEDVYSIIQKVATTLAVPFDLRDISIAHRLQAPRSGRFHPSIVVQFAQRTIRAAWLDAAKKKRINTTDLHPSLSSGPVFVVEHLSPHNRVLLQQAKSMVRENKLAFAWCSNGRILIRKTENSRAIRIFRSLREMEEDVLSGNSASLTAS